MSSYGAQMALLIVTLFTALITLSLSAYHTSLYYGASTYYGGYSSGSGSGGNGPHTTRYYTRITSYGYVPTTIYTTERGLFTTRYLTRYTSVRDAITTGYYTSGVCYGSYCYKKRDTAPPTPTVTSDPTQPTAGPEVPPDYYRPQHSQQSRDVVEQHRDLEPLQKRKKNKPKFGSSGDDDGGGSSTNYNTRIIPIILTIIWASLQKANSCLIVGSCRPTSRYVSVKIDLCILGSFLVLGFAVLIAAVAVLFKNIGPSYVDATTSVPIGGHAFGWILWLLLLSMFLFELIHVKRRYSGAGSFNKSIRTLSNTKTASAVHNPATPNPLEPKPGFSTETSSYAANSIPYSPNPASTAAPPLDGQWAGSFPNTAHSQSGSYSSPAAGDGHAAAYYGQSSPAPTSLLPSNGHGSDYYGQGSPPPGDGHAAAYYGNQQPYHATGSPPPGHYGGHIHQPAPQGHHPLPTIPQ